MFQKNVDNFEFEIEDMPNFGLRCSSSLTKQTKKRFKSIVKAFVCNQPHAFLPACCRNMQCTSMCFSNIYKLQQWKVCTIFLLIPTKTYVLCLVIRDRSQTFVRGADAKKISQFFLPLPPPPLQTSENFRTPLLP